MTLMDEAKALLKGKKADAETEFNFNTAYGDTNATVDPGSVYLKDTADWFTQPHSSTEEWPTYLADQPGVEDHKAMTAAEQGVRTNDGQLHFLNHLEQTMENLFTHHMQSNVWVDMIKKALDENPHVVTIVNPGSDSWNGGQIAIPLTTSVSGQRVVDRRNNRRSITLINNGAVTVYLAETPAVNVDDFRLMAGAATTISTKQQVWAATAAGAAATLVDYFETYDD